MNDGIEQTEAQVEAPEAPTWEPEVEHEAKALGWKSPDEWSGEKPPGYIDNPNDYLKRAESFTPFRKLREQMTAAEKKADDRLRRLESVAGKALERQRADSDRQIAELKAAKLKAVETGDVDEYRALDKRQADIEAATVEPEPAQDSPLYVEQKAAVERWLVGKDWFNTNKIMTDAAVMFYEEAQKKGITDSTALLSHVDARLAEEFPHKFAKTKEATSQTVEAGLTFGGKADEFAKLPAEARDAFKRFVSKGLFEDTKEGRAAYAKDFNDA